MSVAVVVPTVPGREARLAEALASIEAQTRPPDGIEVEVDVRRTGPAAARNRAAVRVPSHVEWVAFLDDDDAWYPNHLSTLLAHSDDADVVYSRGRIVGRPGWDPQRVPFDPERMRRVNFLPCTGIVRRRLFVAVGGFPPEIESPRGYEDWGLWLRLLDAGARFLGVDEITWEYRHGRWPSRSRGNL